MVLNFPFTHPDRFYQILLVRRSPSLAAPGSPALRFPPGSPQIVEHGIVNNASTRQFLAYVAGEVSPQDFAGGVAYFTAGGGNTVMSGFLSGWCRIGFRL